MKKTILSLVLLAMLGMLGTKAEAVFKVVGGQAECDTNNAGCLSFPTQISLLCDGSGTNLDCPQLFSPDFADTTGLRFYGVTNRVNPPRYTVSINGGVTWALLSAQPYAAVVDGLGGGIAVSSSGVIIAPANQGLNNCIIRISIDKGVSWSTAFTDIGATDNCGQSFGAPITNNARCAQNSGYCAVVNPAGAGAFNFTTYFSNDNGINWTKGAITDQVVSGDQRVQIKLDNSGVDGVIGMGQISNGNGSVYKLGDVFREGTGFIWGGARCLGSVIMGTERIICGPNNVATTLYQNFTVGGGIATLANTFELTDAPLFVNGPNFHVEAFSSSIGYLFGRNLAGTKVNVYITTNAFASAILLGQVTPTIELIFGACMGESHKWSGKIYFTCGGSATQAFLGVIQ